MIRVKIDNNKQVEIDKLPNECPYCHKFIDPLIIADNFSNRFLEIIFKCPNLNCLQSFIGSYHHSYGDYYDFQHCNIGELIFKNISEEIVSISPEFVKIYNESYFAEQYNLNQICGVGYRKALEFLIKDYLIRNNPDKADSIAKKFLGNCIKEDVSDPKVRKVAERAIWLGNDETHYVRIWESQSLEDLKKLISLTLHWIEMEELTNSFENNMPSKK